MWHFLGSTCYLVRRNEKDTAQAVNNIRAEWCWERNRGPVKCVPKTESGGESYRLRTEAAHLRNPRNVRLKRKNGEILSYLRNDSVEVISLAFYKFTLRFLKLKFRLGFLKHCHCVWPITPQVQHVLCDLEKSFRRSKRGRKDRLL